MSKRGRMAEEKLTWGSRAIMTLVGIAFIGMIGAMVHQAYWTVKIDSPEWKTQFRGEFPGLDQAAMLPREKRTQVIEQANKEMCPCKCGYTLAGCLKDDRNCPIRSKNMDRFGELVRQAQRAP